MTTKQRIVYGATSEWSTDGTTFTDIPECKGLAVPKVEIEYQEATHLQSVGGYKEYVAGLNDLGVIEIPCGFSTAGYALAHGYMIAKTLVYFKTEMPMETGQTAGDIFEFRGFVTPKLETNAVGDVIGMMLSVRTSGAMTYTEATTA